MISIRSIWSIEGNKEAKKLIEKKTNYLNYTGGAIRTVGNEATQGLYSLSRD